MSTATSTTTTPSSTATPSSSQAAGTDPETTSPTSSSSGGSRPADTVRFGGIQAAIWRNLTKEGEPRYSVTVERRYADDKGDWHSTGSFGRGDLLSVSKAVDIAHSRIYELEAREKAERSVTSMSRTASGGQASRGGSGR